MLYDKGRNNSRANYLFNASALYKSPKFHDVFLFNVYQTNRHPQLQKLCDDSHRGPGYNTMQLLEDRHHPLPLYRVTHIKIQSILRLGLLWRPIAIWHKLDVYYMYHLHRALICLHRVSSTILPNISLTISRGTHIKTLFFCLCVSPNPGKHCP